MSAFIVIVMEHGSEWPAQVSGAAGGCVVLQQEPEEGEEPLLRRTEARIRTIERGRGKVGLAILSCNDSGDGATLESRERLGRALLATVARTGEGRLDLVGRSSAPEYAKASIMALAGTLLEALPGSSASVSARFAEGVTSGTHRAARKATHRADERRSAA
jgi:hypothetical protein